MKTAILNSLSYFAVCGNALILVVKKMFWRPITKSCYDLSDSCHENITLGGNRFIFKYVPTKMHHYLRLAVKMILELCF